VRSARLEAVRGSKAIRPSVADDETTDLCKKGALNHIYIYVYIYIYIYICLEAVRGSQAIRPSVTNDETTDLTY